MAREQLADLALRLRPGSEPGLAAARAIARAISAGRN